jgi:acyl-CoA synthetase (AMP-forming)/AMP-acid ligase II
MIMKAPSLNERKKLMSKRSEGFAIVTSSPYKQSLVENIQTQTEKKRKKDKTTKQKRQMTACMFVC